MEKQASLNQYSFKWQVYCMYICTTKKVLGLCIPASIGAEDIQSKGESLLVPTVLRGIAVVVFQ